MESNDKTDHEHECSLKIDTIWSEADESLLIKEEIISDLEPDFVPSAQENINNSELQLDSQVEDEENCNSYFDAQVLSNWQPSKKKIKSRSQRTEENETIMNHKLSCLHDTKNFKIVKRRLRCGNCRSLVCPECCKVMIPNLQSHFLGSGICNSGTYLCKLCSIIFHSLCALQAHIRIHTMDTPYVCPDCGLIYNNIYFLILHLLNKCYHVYKIVRYKCKQCPGTYFTPENFVQHIQEKHIHCVFRCLYCSSLFNNYDEFNYHMENLHQKQKVQYLNYFRCSLCSNMVIPRFMYQRHVAQHRENSEFYEVDYQCLCGETYSLINAFRSHFSYCSKKGVLPPKWSFLQKKLRTQDVIHHENFQNKDVVIQTLPLYPNNDSECKKLTSLRPEDRCKTSEEDKMEIGGVSVKNNCNRLNEGAVKSTSSEVNRMDICNKENEKSEDKSGPCNNSSINNYKGLANSISKNKFTELSQEEKTAQDNSTSAMSLAGEATNSEGEFTKEKAAESATLDGIRNAEELQSSKSKAKDLEQNDGDRPKIYDHIPRDHLGYVIKTQSVESSKTTCEGDDVIAEKSFSPQNYKFVTELDERTGVITTKSVPLDELEINEADAIDEDDYDLENFNFNSTAKQYCNEKTKFKVSNSLSCPFCIVLFPKHNLTFQQFRLHLESYHPDAALNITMSNGEDKTPCSANPDNLDEPEVETTTIRNLKDAGENLSKLSFPKSPNAENWNKESSPKINQDLNQDEGLKTVITESNERKQTETTEANNDLANETLQQKSNKLLKSSDDGVDETERCSVYVNNGNVQSRESGDSRAGGILSTNVDFDPDSGEFDPEKGNANEETTVNKTERSNNTEEKMNVSRTVEENDDKNKEVQKVEETPEKQISQESSDKISPKTISDFDYEGETSKDSNWSGISSKDTRNNSLFESKTEEKERSRRESEVWSEFYESLMLAEKLKKRKNPSPESEDKKKSVVSDYSSKRVVKKPKRYRESSESGDSNEYSESDEELLLENDFVEKICSEEKSGAEDQPNKKQMLLDKLEHVDGKFVDYLFDLVTKKEKLFELYQKHSTLRANRYGHDLRSYRKKVLNGIKQRGRPLKMLRYHELLKKKELLGEKNSKENYQLKKKSDFSPENKGNEKKRGRPRKYHETAKLKERRRSDKEVDFIEKNFEREENDFSPSKRKRKLSSKLQYYRKLSDEKDDFSSGQVITNKPADSNKKFTCAVCKETFPGLTEFRVHIIAHRMEENTYQCMECGECFVVRPSLEKHLHAFHKIKNTEKYITENQCCSIKKEIVEVEEEPLKENQCKVCKDQFDRPIDLTKHFRIHGMAFLKEFRKEGKSSEKRNAQ